MMQTRNRSQKNPTLLPVVILVLVGLFSALDEFPDGVGIAVVALVIVLIPIIIAAALVTALKKRKPVTHTHDRIDHSTDLKINPSTGKVENSSRRTVENHTAREHWKQQLDALLANGTIDRAEYQAMMNRKF